MTYTEKPIQQIPIQKTDTSYFDWKTKGFKPFLNQDNQFIDKFTEGAIPIQRLTINTNIPYGANNTFKTLSDVEFDQIQGLNHLTELIIHDSSITSPSFYNDDKYKQKYINSVKESLEKLLPNLKELTKLELNITGLTTLPDSITTLQKLNELLIYYRSINLSQELYNFLRDNEIKKPNITYNILDNQSQTGGVIRRRIASRKSRKTNKNRKAKLMISKHKKTRVSKISHKKRKVNI